MKAIIISVLKGIFSEEMIKSVVVALGDYLVSKSSNKLDDKLWAQVKNRLS
mgnify:FL=1|jgi:hypothetical protein|tara:strand:- start:695 stop:847 length:153 start_codon:yes stop_codon:yes gene_type:complete